MNESIERTSPVWNHWGTVISDAGMTSADALREAELDWRVELQPIYQQHDYVEPYVARTPIDGYKATVRSSDRNVLGIVKDRYRVLQNVDAFRFGDDVLDASGAHWVTAGAKSSGSTVWMTARLPEQLLVGGSRDEALDQYFVFTNSHDGSGSVTFMVTPVRAWCQNTLALAMRSASRLHKIKHTQSMNGRLIEARKALDISFAYTEALVEDMTGLLNEKFGWLEYVDLVEELFPIGEDSSKRGRTVAEKNRDTLHDIWNHTPDLQNIRGTKYGALQSVIEFNDWHTKGRCVNTEENKFSRVLLQNNITHRAYDLLKA